MLWIRGDSDAIVADATFFDINYLGQAGVIPGWPGEDGKRGGPPGFVGLFNNPVGRWFMKLIDPRLVITGGLKSAYHDESLVTKELEDRYATLAMGVSKLTAPRTPRNLARPDQSVPAGT